jgi:transposase-like protein
MLDVLAAASAECGEAGWLGVLRSPVMSLAPRLTHAQVLEIRARVAAGETQAAVARDMGIGRDTVSKWVGHERMPAQSAPTKAEHARLRQEACDLKRADPGMGAVTCAGRLGVHQTTVTTWWQDAGLMRVDLRQPQPGPDPFIDLLHVAYRDADVSDEWRRVGLSRWAYVPPRADTAVPRVSEWVA